MTGYAAVRLRGLQAAPQLNDLLGLCKGFDEGRGRWLVELASGEEKAVKNDNVLTQLEPGATLMLERNCVAHVTVGSVASLRALEDEDREYLDSDLAQFAEKFDVRTEINIPDGWPQFSVVMRGVPEQVQAALEELGQLFQHYKFAFTASGAKGAKASSAAGASAAEEEEEIKADGINKEHKSHKEGNRAKQTN